MVDFSQEQELAIDLLKNLISIPRTSRNETQAADFLEKEIAVRGFQTNRHENNIWILSPAWEQKKPTVLLNAHIDTVKPAALWQTDPCVPLCQGDKITGIGSNDDGASLVSLLSAFSLLTQRRQSYNLVFAASAEEEVSGKNGLEALLPYLPPIDLALVGEPTGMQVAVAEKGLMVIDATAVGKSGHAARNEGVNAIYKAVEDISWIVANPLPLQSDLLGPVKMTTTMIQAGTQHNVIPDKCTFVIDVRSNEFYSNQQIFDYLKQNLKSELKARSFRLSSSHISTDNPLVRAFVANGATVFGSPTLSDQALMPFPSLKCGPGDSSRSHTAGEYILKSEIENAIETYFNVLDGLSVV